MNSDLLKSPIISEKSMKRIGEGCYVFEVSPRATKSSLKTALFEHFKVKTTGIRLLNLPAQTVSFRRHKGVRSRRRRAYIQLVKGQLIPGFELPKTESKEKSNPEKEK